MPLLLWLFPCFSLFQEKDLLPQCSAAAPKCGQLPWQRRALTAPQCQPLLLQWRYLLRKEMPSAGQQVVYCSKSWKGYNKTVWEWGGKSEKEGDKAEGRPCGKQFFSHGVYLVLNDKLANFTALGSCMALEMCSPIVLLTVCLEGIQKGFVFSCFTSPTFPRCPKWIRTSWPRPSPPPGQRIPDYT